MPHILCAGIAVLDEVFRVRTLPPPDGKVEASEFITIGGGCAANAAVAIARLGGKVTFAAPLGGPAGDDAIGDRVLSGLEREGIDCAPCMRVPGGRTPVSGIFIDDRGERTIATYRDAAIAATAPADPDAAVAAADVVLADNRFPLSCGRSASGAPPKHAGRD